MQPMTNEEINSLTFKTFKDDKGVIMAKPVNNLPSDHLGYGSMNVLCASYTFPIIGTEEIGLSIDGEDLEAMWQFKSANGLWHKCVDNKPNNAIERQLPTRQVLIYTPKPIADNPKRVDIRKLGMAYNNYLSSLMIPMADKVMAVRGDLGVNYVSVDIDKATEFVDKIELADSNKEVDENQEDREKRAHREADNYYSGIVMSKSEREWYHKGVEFGAKWVDNGDKVII